jgi:hypothetical protein
MATLELGEVSLEATMKTGEESTAAYSLTAIPY